MFYRPFTIRKIFLDSKLKIEYMEGIRQDEISNGLLENLCVTRFKWLRSYIVRVYTRWLLPKIRTTVRQLTDDHMILVSGEIHPGLNV